MKNQTKSWWLLLIKGIVLILLAFYTFMYPAGALVGLALYIGISLMMTGFFLIIMALTLRISDENWGWKLAEGIIDLLFAFILLSNPALTASMIPFIVGFWIMMYGVILFTNSFAVKKSGEETWWVGLLGGIVSILLGFLLINNIFAGALTITYWIGIGFTIAGILSISLSFKLKRIPAGI